MTENMRILSIIDSPKQFPKTTFKRPIFLRETTRQHESQD